MVAKPDYCCYWNQIDAAGWNSKPFHGYFDGCPCGSNRNNNVEVFFGCSDVTVLPGGPTPQPTPAPTPAPAQCCTGQGGQCAAPCSNGGWCGGSSPAPPAPTPAANPTSAPPAPPAPGPSRCCYTEGCTGNCVAGGWCGGSEANCVGCGGDWCSP